MFAEFGVLNFWTYVVGAFFIVLVPGPNTLFVLKTGIGHGIKKGYLAATGVFIGDAVLMFLAWAGVAALIQTTPRTIQYCPLSWRALSAVARWQNVLVGHHAQKQRSGGWY